MTKRPSLAASMQTLAEPTKPEPEKLVAQSKPLPERPARQPCAPAERYAGMKKMLIPVDPAVHRQLRMMALQRDGGTLEKIVQEALADYVAKHA